MIGGESRRRFLQSALAAVAAGSTALAADREITRLSLHEVSGKLRAKTASPVELTRACLSRIERINPSLNAFITITAELALEQARSAEAEIHRGGWRGPLHGVPIGLKDLFDTAGIRTTCASGQFADRIPTEDAEVVRRLKKAGAVILGKLNMDEFAYSFTSESSHFGPVHNPWKLDSIPGGSSSGSAAAVSAELCYAALGSDTGGSIREPAAFCGIVGLKPLYGRVSLKGVVPLSWTLDHAGPMCRTVLDAALVLQTIAGYDASDPVSLNREVPNYARACEASVRTLRLGIPRAMFWEDLDPRIEALATHAVEELKRVTAGAKDVSFPILANSPVLPAEAAAFHEPYLAKSPELYGARVRGNLQRGAQISASAYARGLREIQQLRRDVLKVFDTVDVVVTPTTPRLPVPIDVNRTPDPAFLRNTRPFDHNGLTAITLPCGFSRDGLPVGLQIAGASEAHVFAVAHAFEQATSYHTRRPSL